MWYLATSYSQSHESNKLAKHPIDDHFNICNGICILNNHLPIVACKMNPSQRGDLLELLNQCKHHGFEGSPCLFANWLDPIFWQQESSFPGVG